MWYQVDIGYACFGLKVEGGIVTDAAPIAAWAIGKKADYVFSYFRKNKRGIIISLSEKGVQKCPNCQKHETGCGLHGLQGPAGQDKA